ncbi:MAG: GIY-YIG nuclease family protein [Schwartzia sp.]|nr:GIY-YIG nuclease family protein [Schwartzia sp. (in: firmicutes)]
MTAYVYILECADGTLYTGWTNNLEKRLSAHNAGQGAKYTRSRRPVRLIYRETFDSKEEAQAREWAIKHLSRSEKLALIEAGGKMTEQATE